MNAGVWASHGRIPQPRGCWEPRLQDRWWGARGGAGPCDRRMRQRGSGVHALYCSGSLGLAGCGYSWLHSASNWKSPRVMALLLLPLPQGREEPEAARPQQPMGEGVHSPYPAKPTQCLSPSPPGSQEDPMSRMQPTPALGRWSLLGWFGQA